MKAHTGVDADSGLVHTVIGTAGFVHDVKQSQAQMHGQGKRGFADAGYQGVDKRAEAANTDCSFADVVGLGHWLRFQLLDLCQMELINAVFFDCDQ